MRQRFVAPPPPLHQRRVTPRDGLARGLSVLRLKRAAPQHRLRVVQISFDQQLALLLRRRQIHNRHLPPQAHQQMIPRVNHAAGGIQHQGGVPLLFKLLQDFVKGVNLFGQILGFPLRVGRAVRPAHPRGHAVDSRIPARSQPWRQALLNLVVAKDGPRPLFR